MSAFYTPSLGMVPETREQMLMRLHDHLVRHGIFSGDYNAFLGSNWHRFFSDSVLPMMEEQQALFAIGQAKLFTFWQDSYMAVQGGLGSSYEGFHHIFAPYCTGLNLVTVEHDPTLESAGNVAIYFDDLTLHDDIKKLEQLRELFRRAMPLAILTPRGDYHVVVDFTGSNSKSYAYHNLAPSDYTTLILQVTITYKTGAITYPDSVIEASIREQFEATNRIGRGFYPQSYFDHARLPNIASMQISHRLVDDDVYDTDVRLADFGQKYSISLISIIQPSAMPMEAFYDQP